MQRKRLGEVCQAAFHFLGRERSVMAGFLAAALLLGLALPAFAEKRVALVIGNSEYTRVGALSTPLNDADDVAAKLASLGFDVSLGKNLTLVEFRNALGKFCDALSTDDVALFYYSGQGTRIDRADYLLPIDVESQTKEGVTASAVAVGTVVDGLSSRSSLRLVFVDAGRSDPFEKKSRGLVIGPRDGRADATMIMYSAMPGESPSDGADRNSPFAAAFLRHVGTPGQTLDAFADVVASDVRHDTGGQQTVQTISDVAGGSRCDAGQPSSASGCFRFDAASAAPGTGTGK